MLARLSGFVCVHAARRGGFVFIDLFSFLDVWADLARVGVELHVVDIKDVTEEVVARDKNSFFLFRTGFEKKIATGFYIRSLFATGSIVYNITIYKKSPQGSPQGSPQVR